MYPNDTVRRRMQVQYRLKDGVYGTSNVGKDSFASANTHYRNGLHCYRELYKIYGINIFYKGLQVNIVRSVPSVALQFSAFEVVKRSLNSL